MEENPSLGAPEVSTGLSKHRLNDEWTLWYDNPQTRYTKEAWGEQLKEIYTFDTVRLPRFFLGSTHSPGRRFLEFVEQYKRG